MAADQEHLEIRQIISRLEDRVSEMDKAAGITEALFERNMVVQEKFSATMEKVSEAMVEVKLSLNAMQNEIAELHKEVALEQEARKKEDTRLSEGIKSVKDSVGKIEGDSNVNIIDMAKKMLINALLGGGAYAALLYILEKMNAIK